MFYQGFLFYSWRRFVMFIEQSLRLSEIVQMPRTVSQKVADQKSAAYELCMAL